MVRREVAVEKLGHPQALQGGEQNGDIVHPFDAEHTRRCGVHGLSYKPCSPFREVPLSLSEREAETLEISMDTKAKVSLGDYVRGGKNPDRR
jgi:hypothetical protein